MTEKPETAQAPCESKAQSPTKRWCPITDWTLARITGRDVAKFLQGQVTCNTNILSNDCALWGAHCNVKGRALANFILIQHEENICVLIPKSTLPALAGSLKKYGLFNQIDITESTATLEAISANTNDPDNEQNGVFKKTPYTGGFSLILSPSLSINICTDESASAPSPEEAVEAPNSLWYQGLIDAKLGFITQATTESFIPIELNMDLMGGIAFDKGCYLGQEIIARLHYRGQAKQRLCHLTLPETCPQLLAGTLLYSSLDKSPIGTVICAATQNSEKASHQTQHALAVLRLAQIPLNNSINLEGYCYANDTKPTSVVQPCMITVSQPTPSSG